MPRDQAPRRGQPITAEFLHALNEVARAAKRPGGVPLPLRLLHADADFAEVLDSSDGPAGYYSGDATERYLDRDANTYTIDRGAAVTVYSLDPVREGDLFYATWNAQSGRWERVVAPPLRFTKHQYIPWGFPSSGTVDGDFSIPNPDASFSPVTETITVSWDATAEELYDELIANHASVNADRLSFGGGPWPYNAIELEFRGELSGREIDLPVWDVSGLGGGSFPQILSIRRLSL